VYQKCNIFPIYHIICEHVLTEKNIYKRNEQSILAQETLENVFIFMKKNPPNWAEWAVFPRWYHENTLSLLCNNYLSISFVIFFFQSIHSMYSQMLCHTQNNKNNLAKSKICFMMMMIIFFKQFVCCLQQLPCYQF